MARIRALHLRVSDPEALAAFYCDTLGMQRVEADGEVAVGYGGDGASLVLLAGEGDAYEHHRSDRYWKIAITVPNLELAYAQLSDKGLELSEPHQFRDIAYMSHFTDPEGFVIELLQHTFEDQPRTSDGDAELPLGGGAQLGLITLRTGNMKAELARCTAAAGLHLVSRQSVADLNFDLYFLSASTERPPHFDPNAVENRPWVWQRPYTVLEFQHRLEDAPIGTPEPDAIGAAAVVVETNNATLTLR